MKNKINKYWVMHYVNDIWNLPSSARWINPSRVYKKLVVQKTMTGLQHEILVNIGKHHDKH